MSIEPLPSKGTEESMNRRLTRLDSRIRSQFDLITSRTGWLLSSNAFLFAGIVANLALEKDGGAAAHVPRLHNGLYGILPMLGIVSSLFVGLAVEGAYRIVKQMKGYRTELIKTMNSLYDFELTDPLKQRWVTLGDLPPRLFPWVLIFLWVCVSILVLADKGFIPAPPFSLSSG